MLEPMIEVVCAVIMDPQKGILACRRPSGRHLAGRWEFPGGKVEAKESPVLALIREIREELEVEISVLGELDPVEWQYSEFSIRLRPYRCRIESGELQAHDHEELRWCMPEQLRDLDWADADRPIVEQILMWIR